jgi:LPXTG-motif cell wall-anchored protein/uncharacterized repeat protein (TIGR02543 family)
VANGDLGAGTGEGANVFGMALPMVAYTLTESVVPAGHRGISPVGFAVNADGTITLAGTNANVTVADGGKTIVVQNLQESSEGALTVYKVLLDVNGNIINSENSQYADYGFAVTLTDRTGAEEADVTRWIRHGESANYPVNDAALAASNASLVTLAEDLGQMDGIELVEILPIHWNGDGTAQTTVVNKVIGPPDIDRNDIRVVKYIVYQGRLINDARTENQGFGVALTPLDDGIGRVMIDVPAIGDAVYDFNLTLDYGDDETSVATVVAVVSGGGLEEAIRLDSEGYQWIVFEGLKVGAVYNIEVFFSVAGGGEALYPIYRDTIDFTEYAAWLIAPGARDSVPVTVRYTVAFDYNDDATPADEVEVAEGSRVSPPADPAREGYVFLGWYLGEHEFDFDTTIVEDITLMAWWEAAEGGDEPGPGPEPEPEPEPEPGPGPVGPGEPTIFTVTFDYNDDATAADEVEVAEGDSVAQPPNPARDGYVFMGWYLGGDEFDFGTPITEDITLMARWEEAGDGDGGDDDGGETGVGAFTIVRVNQASALAALAVDIGVGMTPGAEPGSFGGTGTVIANDEEGLLFAGLNDAGLGYLVSEIAIPRNFIFYGMKIGNTGLSMTDDEHANGLEVALTPNTTDGTVVVIFNQYRQSSGNLPDPDPDPIPTPGPGPGPTPPPVPTTPPIVIPDIPAPIGEYTQPPPPEGPEIDDETPPMGNLPQTGDVGLRGYGMIGIGLAGLLATFLAKRKMRTKKSKH